MLFCKRDVISVGADGVHTVLRRQAICADTYAAADAFEQSAVRALPPATRELCATPPL